MPTLPSLSFGFSLSNMKNLLSLELGELGALESVKLAGNWQIYENVDWEFLITRYYMLPPSLAPWARINRNFYREYFKIYTKLSLSLI